MVWVVGVYVVSGLNEVGDKTWDEDEGGQENSDVLLVFSTLSDNIEDKVSSTLTPHSSDVLPPISSSSEDLEGRKGPRDEDAALSPEGSMLWSGSTGSTADSTISIDEILVASPDKDVFVKHSVSSEDMSKGGARSFPFLELGGTRIVVEVASELSISLDNKRSTPGGSRPEGTEEGSPSETSSVCIKLLSDRNLEEEPDVTSGLFFLSLPPESPVPTSLEVDAPIRTSVSSLPNRSGGAFGRLSESLRLSNSLLTLSSRLNPALRSSSH